MADLTLKAFKGAGKGVFVTHPARLFFSYAAYLLLAHPALRWLRLRYSPWKSFYCCMVSTADESRRP